MRLMFLAIAALMFLPLGGCAVLTGGLDAMLEQAGAEPGKVTEFSDKAIGKAVTPLTIYAKAPYVARSGLRDRLNTHPKMVMNGIKIGIWVEGDPPLTLGPDPVPEPVPAPDPDPEPTSMLMALPPPKSAQPIS